MAKADQSRRIEGRRQVGWHWVAGLLLVAGTLTVLSLTVARAQVRGVVSSVSIEGDAEAWTTEVITMSPYEVRDFVAVASGNVVGGVAAAALAKVQRLPHADLVQVRCALADGDLVLGEAMLRWLAQKAEVERVRGQAAYALATLLDARGALEEALAVLEAAPAAVIPGDYAAFARARLLWQLARREEALVSVRQVISQRSSPLYHEAVLAEARLLFELEAWPAAERALSRLLESYPDQPQRPNLLLWRARARMAQGQTSGAVSDLAWIIDQWPWTRAADAAEALVEELRGQGVAVPRPTWEERFARADRLRRGRHWTLAESAMLALGGEDASLSAAQGLRLEVQLARNAYESSDYAKALPLWQALVARCDAGQKVPEMGCRVVHNYVVRTLNYMGRYDDALTALRARDRVLARRQQAEHLLTFLRDNGRFAEALALWNESATERDKGSWDYAFLTFLAGDFEAAAARFATLAASQRGRQWARMRYWQGRALMAQGLGEEARSIFAEIDEHYAMDYYGVLARSRMAEIAHGQVRLSPGGDGEEGVGSAQWIGADGQIFWEGPPWEQGRHRDVATSSSVRHEGCGPRWSEAYLDGHKSRGALARAEAVLGELFPRLSRAHFLHELGMDAEARWELRDVVLEYRGLQRVAGGRKRPGLGKPWALSLSMDGHLVDNRGGGSGVWGIETKERRFPVPSGKAEQSALALRQRAILERESEIWRLLRPALKEVGDYHMVRRQARVGLLGLPGGPAAQQWSDAYPRAFPEEVERQCGAEGLNPYLIWSLMNVESGFNPDSVSHANARGLLQVIPMTGIKIATSIGQDPYGPYDLMDYQVSIRFGVWYFARLVEKFHGRHFLAMAGYNGGPHQVARWLTQRGTAMDLDAFVETIPFNEARNYVQKATRYLGVYQRIYEGSARLYVGNRLDGRFLPQPNY